MYPGGKNSGGAFQTIISQIPPHEIYIELFLGSGAVLRNKRPASVDIGVDLNSTIIDDFDYAAADSSGRNFKFYNESCFEFLNREFHHQTLDGDVFIYADPPYLMETRHSRRPIYQHEFDAKAHERLLIVLRSLPVMVAISGYESDLYNSMLQEWRKVYYQQTDRAGRVRTEVLWCNYPDPVKLHDYRYLGSDFIDRQRIKRKIQRHVDKLMGLPVLERAAIIEALNNSHKSPGTGL